MRTSCRISGDRSVGKAAQTPIAAATVRLQRKCPATQDPLCDAYIDAARSAGLPVTDDYNGAQQDGFARIQVTVEHGRRCSGAVAYLHPALSRPNLTVKIQALATQVVFDRARAVGVEYLQGGAKAFVGVEREVILAGGTINSPQLLMLSGIGDPVELEAHGIAVKVPLSGVGKNLQDHIAALLTYARREGGPFQRNMRLDRLALGIAQGFAFGTGFATSLPGGLTAFLKSDASEPVPDIQLLFIAAPLFEARPYSAAVLATLCRRVCLPAGRAPAGIARCGFPWPRPIRVCRRGLSRTCSPPSGTGTASAREFAYFARSRASRCCSRSSRRRPDLVPPRHRTKRSTPTSARRR